MSTIKMVKFGIQKRIFYDIELRFDLVGAQTVMADEKLP